MNTLKPMLTLSVFALIINNLNCIHQLYWTHISPWPVTNWRIPTCEAPLAEPTQELQKAGITDSILWATTTMVLKMHKLLEIIEWPPALTEVVEKRLKEATLQRDAWKIGRKLKPVLLAMLNDCEGLMEALEGVDLDKNEKQREALLKFGDGVNLKWILEPNGQYKTGWNKDCSGFSECAQVSPNKTGEATKALKEALKEELMEELTSMEALKERLKEELENEMREEKKRMEALKEDLMEEKKRMEALKEDSMEELKRIKALN